jgi:hypothetical protein
MLRVNSVSHTCQEFSAPRGALPLRSRYTVLFMRQVDEQLGHGERLLLEGEA